MGPRLKLDGLANTRAAEYRVRFAFGGGITVCTGLATHAYGPAIGGLFLAFPAILPASLTLLKRHDGRRKAVHAAAGARLGAAALVVFAAVTMALATDLHPAIVLALAALAWAATAIVLWVLVYGRRSAAEAPRRVRKRTPAPLESRPFRR